MVQVELLVEKFNSSHRDIVKLHYAYRQHTAQLNVRIGIYGFHKHPMIFFLIIVLSHFTTVTIIITALF